MSGSAVAPLASLTAPHAVSAPGVPEPDGAAGSLKWQRARLVLDQHQRGVEVGPVGRVLPVRAELADLLPYRGLRRGSTVVVRGSTTVLLALLAEATADGSWAAVVGMPDLGLLAAAELGVALSRLALVPDPGAELGGVVSALLDGLDLVVATGVPAPLARRLSARARHRESVLLTADPWPGADLELDCRESRWTGLGNGHGHLESRTLTITTTGRGSATRPTQATLTLPAPSPPVLLPAHHPRLPETRDTTHPTVPAAPPATQPSPAGRAASDIHPIAPAAQTSAPAPADETADAARLAGRRPGLASVPEPANEPSARPRPAPSPAAATNPPSPIGSPRPANSPRPAFSPAAAANSLSPASSPCSGSSSARSRPALSPAAAASPPSPASSPSLASSSRPAGPPPGPTSGPGLASIGAVQRHAAPAPAGAGEARPRPPLSPAGSIEAGPEAEAARPHLAAPPHWSRGRARKPRPPARPAEDVVEVG